MDREAILRRLAEAEERVELGEHNLTRQREIIARLDRDGFDASGARMLLLQFEEAQALHLAERDRLRKEAQSAG
jgi:hypothetical protein